MNPAKLSPVWWWLGWCMVVSLFLWGAVVRWYVM